MLKTFNLSLAASMYNEIESTSKPIKNMAKFPKETIAIAPVNRKTLMAIKSENFDCLSL